MSGSLNLKLDAKARCLMALIRKLDPSCNDPTKFMSNQIQNVFVCLRNGIQQPWFDWKLSISSSKIPDSGRGLYIDGHAPAGRLLCMYAGAFWPEESITKLLTELDGLNTAQRNMEDIASKQSDENISKYGDAMASAMFDSESSERQGEIITILDNLFSSNFIYARDDGTLLDATGCEKLYTITRDNPLAMGQYCNHPNKEVNGNIPNIMAVDVPWNFSDININPNCEVERKYCPTWYHLDRNINDGNVGISNSTRWDNKITCFVAIRDLKNEELYFDYEFEGIQNEKLPKWYQEVDYNVYLDAEKMLLENTPTDDE